MPTEIEKLTIGNMAPLPAVTATGEFETEDQGVSGKVSMSQIVTYLNTLYIALDKLGAANGAVPLDASGKVDSQYLPSFVDDVIEATTKNDFPVTGESAKIYVALDSNISYRWGGSAYVALDSGGVISINGERGVITGVLTKDNSFDDLESYALKALTTGGDIDLTQANIAVINPGSGSRTVRFTTQPGAGRATTSVVVLKGDVPVTWDVNGWNLNWAAGNPPELGTDYTLVTLVFVDGSVTGVQVYKKDV